MKKLGLFILIVFFVSVSLSGYTYAQDKTMKYNDFTNEWEIYEENEYGIKEQTGSIEYDSFRDEYDVYERNEFGIEEKKGSWKYNEFTNEWEYEEDNF